MTQITLQPKAVFDCFAQINKIPRPSNKEQKMAAFLVDFGKKLGLETLQDAAGNVLIRKPATPGKPQAHCAAKPHGHGMRKGGRLRLQL